VSTSTTDPRIDAAADLAARGDGDAFEVLCSLLNDDVWRYCSAVVGDPELAADAAQETFVRLVSAIRRFKGQCPARVYTLIIARRACAATVRADARHGRHRDLTSHDVPAVPAEAGAVDTRLLLDQLPADLRQAFVLTQLLGLPYADAARVAGSPVGTIRSRVFRAREHLVNLLTAAEGEDRDVL
jgi:RNA polymerase sigma-70 factor (ECF subfamily)